MGRPKASMTVLTLKITHENYRFIVKTVKRFLLRLETLVYVLAQTPKRQAKL